MLGNKLKILVLFIIFSFNSFSSLKCNIEDKVYNKYSSKLSYLKIENNDLYRAYLLVNNDEILIEDNKDKVLPLASVTKIMTAMVVLDNVKNLDEIVPISKKTLSVPYGTKLDSKINYTVKDLLYIMLISSTNAAAEALKEYVSSDFISLMNEKAKQIGANTATYCTSHGLPPRYTNSCMDSASAYDVYKISKYAIENYELIREIVSTDKINIKGHNLKNTNELLTKIDGVKGLKTGFHNDSMYNIVIYYNKNNDNIFEVILGSDSTKNRTMITNEVISQFGGTN